MGLLSHQERPLLNDAQMVFFYSANSELEGTLEENGCTAGDGVSLTISVASTRVPTIFRRTRVSRSIIYKQVWCC